MLFPLRSNTWQYDIITLDICHTVTIIIIPSPGWRAPLPLVSPPGLCWYTPPSPSHSSRYKHRSKQPSLNCLINFYKSRSVATITITVTEIQVSDERPENDRRQAKWNNRLCLAQMCWLLWLGPGARLVSVCILTQYGQFGSRRM